MVKNKGVNPWQEISKEDYLGHMSSYNVLQLQTLNKVLKDLIDFYHPNVFVYPGCTNGNGLEYLDSSIVEEIYAIDINEEYLEECRGSYSYFGDKLITIQCDFDIEKPMIGRCDLIHFALFLEYVEVFSALEWAYNTLDMDGYISIIIQENRGDMFVSKTKYTSLEELKTVSHTVKADDVLFFFAEKQMSLVWNKEIDLPANKAFRWLLFRK
ncbi:MAG: class I SAM-dependent methyltransferase [Hyphomicrobiales bacterium]